MSLKWRIIDILRKVGEATAMDIARQLNVDINTIRSYMYILHKQNVVVRKKQGKKYVYSLASPSPPSDLLPPPSSSSTSKVKTSFNVKKSKNTDDMKNDIRNGLYNEKVNINSTFNVKSFNVKTTDAKVKNKYIFNLDSCLYEIEKLKQEINELRSYIQSIFNVKSRSIFNVKTGLVEEEGGGGVRGSSPPGAGVGREWAYTILAILGSRKLAQYLLAQNNDTLSIMILEKLLTHYIITNNKFIVFSDYRELIEYFNLNVNDIIKSKQTLNKAITKLASNGLVYFIKVNNNIKLGLKRKALKTILT